jgi:hypothetical protein
MANSETQLPKSVDPSVMEKKETSVGDAESRSEVIREKEDHAADAPQEEEAAVEATEKNEEGSEPEEETQYPQSWKLGLITIALCLSVFCMALVCCPTKDVAFSKGCAIIRSHILRDGKKYICVDVLKANSSLPGQHHHCHRHSQDYGSVQGFGRRRLVW